jgi:hypothetical protein
MSKATSRILDPAPASALRRENDPFVDRSLCCIGNTNLSIGFGQPSSFGANHPVPRMA